VLRLRAAAGLLKRKIAAIGVSATGRQGQAAAHGGRLSVAAALAQSHREVRRSTAPASAPVADSCGRTTSLTSEFHNRKAT
jgi:hypothetical protein